MFHLFRSKHRRKELDEDARRNDGALDDLRNALERLLAERNRPKGTAKEGEQ